MFKLQTTTHSHSSGPPLRIRSSLKCNDYVNVFPGRDTSSQLKNFNTRDSLSKQRNFRITSYKKAGWPKKANSTQAPSSQNRLSTLRFWAPANGAVPTACARFLLWSSNNRRGNNRRFCGAAKKIRSRHTIFAAHVCHADCGMQRGRKRRARDVASLFFVVHQCRSRRGCFGRIKFRQDTH